MWPLLSWIFWRVSKPRLAWRFLNAYLEQGGDYQGLVMLRFYVMYRALVRAKVAMLRVRQLSRGSHEQILQIESSKAHVLLALEQNSSCDTLADDLFWLFQAREKPRFRKRYLKACLRSEFDPMSNASACRA